jgi:hypothetical protein
LAVLLAAELLRFFRAHAFNLFMTLGFFDVWLVSVLTAVVVTEGAGSTGTAVEAVGGTVSAVCGIVGVVSATVVLLVFVSVGAAVSV